MYIPNVYIYIYLYPLNVIENPAPETTPKSPTNHPQLILTDSSTH